MAYANPKTGRVALVTDCDKELGRAVALGLARAGTDVAIHVRDARDGEPVAEAARRLGVEASIVVGDVVDFESCGDVVDAAVRHLGRVDTLVSCVGIRPHSSVVDMTIDEWRLVIDTNCSSFFYLSKLLLPTMIEAGFGRLLAVSVALGDRARTHHASVAAARSALNELVKCIAVEAGSAGITANIVSPAIDETARLELKSEPVLHDLLAIPRPGRLAEIAAACVYLASSDADYITGQTLHVDGGYTI